MSDNHVLGQQQDMGSLAMSSQWAGQNGDVHTPGTDSQDHRRGWCGEGTLGTLCENWAEGSALAQGSFWDQNPYAEQT